MTNIKISFTMARGVATLPGNNPFDGVLAKLCFERQKREGVFDGDFAQRLPFLEWDEEGFYHISNPLYKVEAIENRTLTKGFDQRDYLALTSNKKLTKEHYNPKGGPWKMYVAGHEYSHVKTVTVYARGDRGRIESLLSGLTHLGKKSSHGAGEIRRIEVEEIPDDLSVVDSSGNLNRPVPVGSRYLGSKGADGRATRLIPLTHPYWDRGREVAVVIEEEGGSYLGSNALTENPQDTLSKVFGRDQNKILLPKHRKYHRVEDNTTMQCKMCGRVYPEGYHDPTNRIIPSSNNGFYGFIRPRSAFVCDPCQYNRSHSMVRWQADLDRVYGEMYNIVLYADRFEPKIFTSGADNELYDLFVNPPSEPFVVIMKDVAGTSPIDASHRLVPTVDSGYVCLNFGMREYFVSTQKVFRAIECAEDIFALAKKKKLTLSEDTLFNRLEGEKYFKWLQDKTVADDEVHERMRHWFGEYDRAHRFAAKAILNRYRKEQKNKGKTK